jgi:hypothetical protein
MQKKIEIIFVAVRNIFVLMFVSMLELYVISRKTCLGVEITCWECNFVCGFLGI